MRPSGSRPPRPPSVTELNIIQNVEQAQIAVTDAAERIQAAQAAVASAEENFRLAQGRFDAGVGTILELTDAQLALTQSQNTESQALSDFRISLYRLDRALGRREIRVVGTPSKSVMKR